MLDFYILEPKTALSVHRTTTSPGRLPVARGSSQNQLLQLVFRNVYGAFLSRVTRIWILHQDSDMHIEDNIITQREF